MKMSVAVDLMKRGGGYRVHFEKRGGGVLQSDYFPERDERPIWELEEAWNIAEKWAALNPELYVNVYVVSAYDWTPVENYQSRKLNVYPPECVDAASPSESEKAKMGNSSSPVAPKGQ